MDSEEVKKNCEVCSSEMSGENCEECGKTTETSEAPAETPTEETPAE